MPDQLTFDLPIKTAFGREDFFVTSSNSTAVKILENWKNWPLSKLILRAKRFRQISFSKYLD